ncbi:MAG: hypothetical protein NZ934_01335, partial [Hadesarchaea archaeon]|nr:hypothetical protein [Hadesarchaea archaeon]
STGEWSYLSTPPDAFKNGTCLAWDNGNYIYALLGASYADIEAGGRFFFYRYSISNNTWVRLPDTPHTCGPGSAITFVPGRVLGIDNDNFLYAMLGSNGASGSRFYRYSIASNSWSAALSFPWDKTDDGASLVWTGGNYLYALRGEWHETIPCYDFWRYDLLNNTWENRENIPAYPHSGGSGGVGDGGSLLWIGGAHSDYIYALSGNQAYPEPIWDNRFYRYTISTNSWERLENLPKGVGDQNGPRLGFAGGKIYCWRGCNNDRVLWAYTLGTTLAAPTLVAPADGSLTNDNTPTFRWENAYVADNYEIWVDNDQDFSSPEIRENVRENSYSPTIGLRDGSYRWRVRAYVGSNVSGFSQVWTFTVDATPPSSIVNTISPYWQTSSSFAVTAAANDALSGVRKVALWYRHSSDNLSWGEWTWFENDNSPPWSWTFTSPRGD